MGARGVCGEAKVRSTRLVHCRRRGPGVVPTQVVLGGNPFDRSYPTSAGIARSNIRNLSWEVFRSYRHLRTQSSVLSSRTFRTPVGRKRKSTSQRTSPHRTPRDGTRGCGTPDG